MSKQLTSLEWLTSDEKEAVAWRKEASLEAWNRVYARAQAEIPGKILNIPPRRTEPPPTRAPKYFSVPEGSASSSGTYFTMPVQEEK